ncbi:hypothetical protein PtrSN002B_000167 [Pyrenophora tritici-repentis]|uniref:Trichoplein multi-domain protein n=2 Tax=Pyrenophora tritici-repentis TaxID=45151 RepID=A0A2W1HJR1_9PLEO|nr:uncharacterized protein PTRG_07000 [Pyrenophora tritici-repentis Pt-1C-BFP]KAA8614552.1 hypothetical protein PtrV1_11582 [Pyrenophora tritici-repentis]EDU49919.1 predicted protein [Pyrenophora tritici-repentis Pt-1C-BFP]KAF7444386.1 hypothetical protein A1F99_109390 [Pyrenophora tritici-repentis]KAF7564963.1 Trichoplein multi-domain protein [Pyrenophora tritici-repentis]KAG9378624.1 hypothetical protein A1F94_010393 [Pyrenophora tritici-repentis]
MPDQKWDPPTALSTAPIFDDAVYLAEALHLPVNETEDQLDAELVLLASESGIADPYRFVPAPKTIARAISSMTLDSDERSSKSIHSHETQSTTLTSAPSRTSRDHLYPSDRLSAKMLTRSLSRSRPTRSVEKHQQATPCPGPGIGSVQCSPLSASPSAVSLPTAQRQPRPRKKRGSAIFNIFRKDTRFVVASRLPSCLTRDDSNACTANVTHHRHHRDAKLECGHSLSAYNVRGHMLEATNGGAKSATHLVPNCCGNPLPPSVLEIVLTKETDISEKDEGPSPATSTFRDSGYCEAGIPAIGLPNLTKGDIVADNLPSKRTRHAPINIEAALANEAFKSFKTQQTEQFEHVSSFECTQRKALEAHHQTTLQRLKVRHDVTKEELIEQHTEDLERLEERQLLAEHDMIKAHAQETQNVCTALKYIEAYCVGTREEQDRTHTVSEDDLKKLERQKATQRELPRKHASAINVLRARQEVDMERRLEAQEAELEQLDADYEKEVSAKEAEYKKESERLEGLIATRRKRLLQRWDLRFEMWRKGWEEQNNTTLDAKLEHETWPPRKADHAITISDASALYQYLEAAVSAA